MKLWHGEHTVGLQHLKSYDYLPAECEQMQFLSDACGGLRLRIIRSRENENLKDAPSASAQSLGELKRPYLTPVEEKLLGFIEKEYGIIDEVLSNSR